MWVGNTYLVVIFSLNMSSEQFSTFVTPLLGIKIKFPSRYSVNTEMGSLTDLVLEDPDGLFSVIIVKRSVDKQETLEQVFEDFYDDTPEHLGAKSYFPWRTSCSKV